MLSWDTPNMHFVEGRIDWRIMLCLLAPTPHPPPHPLPKQTLGYAQPNMRFVEGRIEDLAAAGIADASIDLVISNCVVRAWVDRWAGGLAVGASTTRTQPPAHTCTKRLRIRSVQINLSPGQAAVLEVYSGWHILFTSLSPFHPPPTHPFLSDQPVP